jgi:hypothetical protein
MLFKVFGAHWSRIATSFPGRAVNEVKNRFYTTLRRAATRAHIEDPNRFNAKLIRSKSNLIQFVDAAILYGGSLTSKRGRKKKQDIIAVRTQGPSFGRSAGSAISFQSLLECSQPPILEIMPVRPALPPLPPLQPLRLIESTHTPPQAETMFSASNVRAGDIWTPQLTFKPFNEDPNASSASNVYTPQAGQRQENKTKQVEGAVSHKSPSNSNLG